ncbi:MAG: hypothetical protein ABF290_12990 [Thiogranum sp.]
MDKHREVTSDSVEQLRYHLQFTLGPRIPDDLDAWPKRKVGDNLYLAAHPDLNLDEEVGAGASAILIGYMLDPSNPQASNSDILHSLISRVSQDGDLFAAIEPLGGRWALIVNDKLGLRLVGDAAGLRQIFYSDTRQTDELWCASQPRHIAEALQLQMDREAVDFIEWFQTKGPPESWWPGDSSQYREVRRLLPNHYLDLKTGRPQRFWPFKKLAARSLDDALDGVAETLAGMMQSAAQRFDLAVAMSAGWDSRLMLAACKPIAAELCCYTSKRPDMDWNHMDVDIPTKLLAKLGLAHDIIELRPEVSPAFAALVNRNVPFAHTSRFAALQTELNYYQGRKVGVTGNVSEVARCFYPRPDSPGQAVTAEYLMTVTGLQHPFAAAQYSAWLNKVSAPMNYNILDLFYWEQRAGSWFAQNCLEFDTTWYDVFVPFNSRGLLMEMLAVDEADRQAPGHELYRQLMLKLWPAVLSEPINPNTTPKGLKRLSRAIERRLKRFLR